MNTKTLFMFAIISVFTLSIQTVDAKKKESLFEINQVSINSVKDTELTKFDFEIIKNDPTDKIVYYRIRTYCPKAINIKLNSELNNVCGKIMRIEDLDKNNFSLLYSNQTNKISKFFFKVKAYDKNGKWLETDKKSFSWK